MNEVVVSMIVVAAAAFVVVVCVATLLFLVFRSDATGDLGPWRLDVRAYRNGKCRYRSMDSRARCSRDDGHRGHHVPGASTSW